MLKGNRIHTPEGTADILEAECSAKDKIQKIFSACFEAYGYANVQTPMFEYNDVFAAENGENNDESTIKFFDAKGRILTLRPDFTPQIARMIATKLSNRPMPLRLSYIGTAFRNDQFYTNVKQKEFMQAGVEMIGVNSPEADAEIIALSIDALKAAGLNEFQIDIGQVGFFKALTQQMGLTPEYSEELRLLIDRKDFLGLEVFLDKQKIQGELAQIVRQMPSLFGNVDVIDTVSQMGLYNGASAAIANLKDVFTVLGDYGVDDYISVDFGMVSNLEYYTGTIFRGFTRGVGFPICGGGRYDNMISRFGADLPATGVALWVDRILAALIRQDYKPKMPANDVLVCYDAPYRSEGVKVAMLLRGQGLKVELHTGNMDPEDFARAKGIGGYTKVIGESQVEIVNLATGEVQKVDIDKLGVE